MTGELVPARPDRLEPGEGIRWADGHMVLVDILTGRGMYPAHSARGVVRRYPVGAATARLGTPEVIATPQDGSADGTAVDTEGASWCAVRGTGTLRRHLPDGTLLRVRRLPAAQPAGACPADGVLHVTTARTGPASPGPYDGAMFSVPVEMPDEVPGTPTPSCRFDVAVWPAAPTAGESP
ncbi:SMP-30/gluconolactonase/LRE family protein [Streptomyces sp. NPDC006012]|uniref:SMP-30/gluconolactonase/LRE family protein n=1 Tax=Streptomyces sp. NPDC006012 TaxID=3364739 RepID=UPI0036AFAD1F